MTIPHAHSLHRRLGVKMGIQSHPGQLMEMDHRLGHKHCFTIDSIEEVFFKANLEIVKKQGLGVKILPCSYLTNCNDSQLEGMFELGFDLPIEFSSTLFYLLIAK